MSNAVERFVFRAKPLPPPQCPTNLLALICPLAFHPHSHPPCLRAGILLALIFLAMPWAAIGLSDQLGRTRKENLTLSKIFKQSYNVNVLSFSRCERVG